MQEKEAAEMKAMKQQQKLLAAQQATAFNPMAQGMMGMENQVSTAPPLPPPAGGD